MNQNQYECASCHGVFEKGRPDEEAMTESKVLFGDLPKEDLDVVCDDCFKEMSECCDPKSWAEEYRKSYEIHCKLSIPRPVPLEVKAWLEEVETALNSGFIKLTRTNAYQRAFRALAHETLLYGSGQIQIEEVIEEAQAELQSLPPENGS